MHPVVVLAGTFVAIPSIIALPYLFAFALLSVIFTCSTKTCKWMIRDGPRASYYHGDGWWVTFFMCTMVIAIASNLTMVGSLVYNHIVADNPSEVIESPAPSWGNSTTVTIDAINRDWRWSFADTSRDLRVVYVCGEWSTAVVQSANRTIATAQYSVFGRSWWVNVSTGLSFMAAGSQRTLPFVAEYVTLFVYKNSEPIAYSTDVRAPWRVRDSQTGNVVLEINEDMTSMNSTGDFFQPHEVVTLGIVNIFGDDLDPCNKKASTFSGLKYAGYTIFGFFGFVLLIAFSKISGCC